MTVMAKSRLKLRLKDSDNFRHTSQHIIMLVIIWR